MKTRLLAALTALVLAVLGAVLINGYVQGADARALAGIRTTSVLVVRRARAGRHPGRQARAQREAEGRSVRRAGHRRADRPREDEGQGHLGRPRARRAAAEQPARRALRGAEDRRARRAGRHAGGHRAARPRPHRRRQDPAGREGRRLLLLPGRQPGREAVTKLVFQEVLVTDVQGAPAPAADRHTGGQAAPTGTELVTLAGPPPTCSASSSPPRTARSGSPASRPVPSSTPFPRSPDRMCSSEPLRPRHRRHGVRAPGHPRRHRRPHRPPARRPHLVGARRSRRPADAGLGADGARAPRPGHPRGGSPAARRGLRRAAPRDRGRARRRGGPRARPRRHACRRARPARPRRRPRLHPRAARAGAGRRRRAPEGPVGRREDGGGPDHRRGLAEGRRRQDDASRRTSPSRLGRVAPSPPCWSTSTCSSATSRARCASSPSTRCPTPSAAPASQDSMVLKTFLTEHPSGLYAVCAPTIPAEADRISGEDVGRLLQQLAREFRYVVVDTAPGLGEQTLAALERATEIVMLTQHGRPGRPRAAQGARRHRRELGLVPAGRHIAMNFADRGAGLSIRDIEATIERPVSTWSSRAPATSPTAPTAACRCCRSGAATAMAKELRALVGRFAARPRSMTAGRYRAQAPGGGAVKLAELARPRSRHPRCPRRTPVAVPVPSLKPVVTPRPEPVQDALAHAEGPGRQGAVRAHGQPDERPEPHRDDLLHLRAREALDEVVEEENVPLSNEERHRLVRGDQPTTCSATGRCSALLDDPTVTEIMVNGPDMIYVERARQADAAPALALHLRGAPAPGHRADRLPGRPPHRRVLAAGRRAPRRRLARQRDHPAARRQRLHAHHPQVLRRTRSRSTT